MGMINDMVSTHSNVVPSAKITERWMKEFSLSTIELAEVVTYIEVFVDVVRADLEAHGIKGGRLQPSPMTFGRMATCYKKFGSSVHALEDSPEVEFAEMVAIQRRMKWFEKLINVVLDAPLPRHCVQEADAYFHRLKMFEVAVDVWAKARRTSHVFQWKKLVTEALDASK